ncbi:hypothetical protein [Paraburkholderia dinghuensis]|nr:hypothetical protein [Paraburkholderia dinghuensis]
MHALTRLPLHTGSLRRASGFAIFAGGMLVLAVHAAVRLFGG